MVILTEFWVWTLPHFCLSCRDYFIISSNLELSSFSLISVDFQLNAVRKYTDRIQRKPVSVPWPYTIDAFFLFLLSDSRSLCFCFRFSLWRQGLSRVKCLDSSKSGAQDSVCFLFIALYFDYHYCSTNIVMPHSSNCWKQKQRNPRNEMPHIPTSSNRMSVFLFTRRTRLKWEERSCCSQIPWALYNSRLLRLTVLPPQKTSGVKSGFSSKRMSLFFSSN